MSVGHKSLKAATESGRNIASKRRFLLLITLIIAGVQQQQQQRPFFSPRFDIKKVCRREDNESPPPSPPPPPVPTITDRTTRFYRCAIIYNRRQTGNERLFIYAYNQSRTDVFSSFPPPPSPSSSPMLARSLARSPARSALTPSSSKRSTHIGQRPSRCFAAHVSPHIQLSALMFL